MTKQKYKVGDEVLVRAFIDAPRYSGNIRVRVGSSSSSGCDISESTIYSKAPEFNYGEEIEVSDDHVNWYAEAKFISHNFDSHLPFIIKIDGKNLAYRYARKIQPKKEENILMFGGKKYKLVEE